MILHTALFGADERYARMARVLAASARRNSPSTPLVLHRIDDDDRDIQQLGRPRRRINLTNNARKTRHHHAIVQAAADGELIGLIDCDTLITGDLAEIEAHDFDLAVTERPTGPTINSGVVFVRVSPLMRHWYDLWLEAVLAMLADASFHRQYEPRCGGVNQSALGHLLETSELKPRVLRLPCAIWNSTTETWPQFSAETKVVHLLAKLRLAALRGKTYLPPPVGPLAKLWDDYERYAAAPNTETLQEKA